MTNEGRSELPQSYQWQEVPELKAAFPKPDEWFYRYEDLLGTRACFITREPILADHPFTTRQEFIEGVATGKGFRTGLHLNSFGKVSKRTGVSPTTLARRALTQNPLLIPQSRLEVVQDRPLITYRGYFRSGSQLLVSKGMPPLHYYMEATGNNKTDRIYMIAFETPEELWVEDCRLAKVMIENRLLSKEI